MTVLARTSSIINDRPILSSERMLNNAYNRKCPVKNMLVVRLKGLVAKTN
jgi:hypothetical protein